MNRQKAGMVQKCLTAQIKYVTMSAGICTAWQAKKNAMQRAELAQKKAVQKASHEAA